MRCLEPRADNFMLVVNRPLPNFLCNVLYLLSFIYIYSLLLCTGIDDDVLMDADFFNFAVSLWENMNPENKKSRKNNVERYIMLCVGTLIKSN